MNIPQPFQYQGSKRGLASRILEHLPRKMTRLVEPFAGSGAISLACAGKGRCREYWLNDLNRPLSELLSLIVDQPEKIANFYQSIWHDRDTAHLLHKHVRGTSSGSSAASISTMSFPSLAWRLIAGTADAKSQFPLRDQQKAILIINILVSCQTFSLLYRIIY